MHILDIPFRLLPAPSTNPLQPNNLPALPQGELDALLNARGLLACHSGPAEAGEGSAFPETRNGFLIRETETSEVETVCQYQTSSGVACPRPVIHYAGKEQPEEYCAAHLAWIEQVEEKFDVPYPESPQALLDLLAHTTARVLDLKMTHDQAEVIMKLVRAMERQLRWM
jgi:hypothetical protein